MPHKNQMLGLMKLALDRTSNTINLIFDYAIGAAIFGAVFIATTGQVSLDVLMKYVESQNEPKVKK